MEIKIRGEKQEITEAMKAHAEEKINKLSKYIEKEEEVEAIVLFKVTGNEQKVEITIPLKNVMLRVEEKGKDFYAIIDTAIDKLERQIRKSKTRLKDKKNARMKMDFINLEYEEEGEEEEKIVKRKSVELKPMDEEEAILQMELLDHDFYIFTNIDNNKVSVVYKRKDKGYGLIEEE